MTMQNRFDSNKTLRGVVLSMLLSLAATTVQAASTDIANVPMAVSNMVTPNVLVIYDDSQSMDAYMGGTLVSGNDPLTRGNIGRGVMRTTITNYRSVFNWGLMSYEMSSTPALRNTYGYYLGSNTGMVFTDDCVGYVAGTPPTVGRSASNGNIRCVANPQPFTGGNYVTYDKTGDDSDVLDVLYTNGVYPSFWGLTAGTGTSYSIYQTHNTGAGNSWAAGAFTGQPFGTGAIGFTATDAGYLPSNPPIQRQLYLPRGWGYSSNVTGNGRLYEEVKVDSTTHYNTLQTLLGNETNAATGEIKNGAVFTTLTGTLNTSKNYFAGTLSGLASPTKYTCQQNFVMLVTDGLPTGDTSGNLYSAADRTNTCDWSTTNNSCTSGTFGTAATHAINAVTALRTTAVTNLGISSTNKDGTGAVTGNYDVQTYVVALGDTVANAGALSVMNAMAYNGGTATALLTTDAAAFQNAITKISDDITAKVGSSAAVAVANAHVTSTDNASYASKYDSGTWTGDINSFPIDIATGLPSTTSQWVAGSAAAQLDLRSSASRLVATSVATAGSIGGIQFQPTTATTATKLTAAQQTLLNTPTTTDGAAVLAYLRGDRTNEGATYRVRVHLLGDIINAEPLLVRGPTANYADTDYGTFKASNSSRTRMLYQGANDGMLHAFEAATGAESWAYVPNLVIANLNNLSRKTGFTHQYYVDGTAVSGDVDFKNVEGATGSGTDWRTIVVGGLGKGGRGYYALDVSTPGAATEVDVKNKVLWEFPNSISNTSERNAATLNMGYSFGKPIIVKTKAKGWVVLVTAGYNNGTNTGDSGGDGLGRLYVVNPKTGDLIKDIPTTGCSATPTTSPCGLAYISAYVSNGDVDNTVEYVYGGDLQGNIWRFDLTSNAASGWSVAKFTTLKDSSAVAQPITTAPELALLSINGANARMVYVGTGKYLGNSDVSTTQTQTMYGLRDQLVALPDPLRASLVQQTITTTFSATTPPVPVSRTVSNNAVDYASKKGWYIDLPTSGERVSTDPGLALGALVFTSNIPSATVCVPGGSSWQYFINVKTGGLVENSTVPWSGTYLGAVLASRPVLIQLPSGKVISLVRTSDARTTAQEVPLSPPPTGKRVSWRELVQ
ncbi:PilC/PilY family type IV pilus protein [Accumulibacter sp.]|uniref:PilC/PilY family type IV pilus protein n=1 Tax=Accumulibacter sp. TaxID=2053492 RepID=UPI0028C45803|nr:PilC/PilY family type IV pilus protein [Accumulibacter sp.]